MDEPLPFARLRVLHKELGELRSARSLLKRGERLGPLDDRATREIARLDGEIAIKVAEITRIEHEIVNASKPPTR